MLNHGENLFENAQQAREVLQDLGFIPLCQLGSAEHHVRGNRRVILKFDVSLPCAETPLKGAEYVWFHRVGDEITASF